MRTIHFTLPVLATLLGSACLVGCIQEEGPSSSSDFATEASRPEHFAPDQAGESENQALYKEYCVQDAEMTKRPLPNYENDEVMDAARKLSEVAGHSYSLYGDIN